MVTLYFNLLKLFFIYHINQITYKLSQSLPSNPLTFTSKSFKRKETNFTSKSTQIHPLPLPKIHLQK